MTTRKLIHISDIHFGEIENEPAWDNIKEFIIREQPAALLITGDIVNTPKPRLFERAAFELSQFKDIQIIICPGNHDRYFLGNRIVSWGSTNSKNFFYYLQRWYHAAPNAVTINLGERLLAKITAIDSSDKARFFARSYIDEQTCNDISRAFANQTTSQADKHKITLRILLTHHHLLPIPTLESKADHFLGPFIKTTTQTINSGTVLKTLAENNVDLVFMVMNTNVMLQNIQH